MKGQPCCGGSRPLSVNDRPEIVTAKRTLRSIGTSATIDPGSSIVIPF
jgi:hypothetical protein